MKTQGDQATIDREKITVLSQEGGIVNYRTWLIELDCAFISDRSRLNTAYKRITLATSNMG
jgi:hypothetical protein